MASKDNQLISMDDVDDILDKSTFESPKQSIHESPKKSTYRNAECPEPVASRSPQQSMSENPQQSTRKSPIKASSECLEPVTSGNIEHSISGNPKQCKSSTRKRIFPGIYKQYESESPEQSTSGSIKRSTPGSHAESTLRSLEPLVSKSAKQSMCGSSKQSSSECPKPVASGSIKYSIPRKSIKYRSSRHKQILSGRPKPMKCLPSNDKNNSGKGKGSSTQQTESIDDALLDPEKFDLIMKNIDGLETKLDNLNILVHGKSSSEMYVVDQSFLSLFPMQEVKDIVPIDSRIEDWSEFEGEFMAFIESFKCTELKDFIEQVLKRLFTNNLATNCSWFGFEGKFELKNLNMFKVMNDVACVLHYKSGNTGQTSAMFNLLVKEWFEHAEKRLNLELNRKS